MSGQYYYDVYLFFVTLFTIGLFQSYNQNTHYRRIGRGVSNLGLAWIICIVLVFFIGLRPMSVFFGDTLNYYHGYIGSMGQPFVFTWATTNYIFDNLYSFMSSYGFDPSLFFLSMSAIYFVFILLACQKLLPQDTLLAFLVYLAGFSTFSYGTNGLKAGAAASLFLVAVAYRDKKILAVVFLFLSIGFHHSMALPIAAYIVASLLKKKKYYLMLWLMSLVMAIFHVTYFQEIFYSFADEQGQGYLSLGEDEKILAGFRPDFTLYSAIPVFIGYYFTKRKRITSNTYDFIWCIYTICNSVWLLCTWASFNNRIAYLSWFLYPIILLYPFVFFLRQQNRIRYLRWVVYGHLGFTLFMHIIYY